MTLIVARKIDNTVSIVSDTLLTIKSEGNIRLKQRPEDGTVKCIIINPTQCVSFAGNSEYARLALQQIRDGKIAAEVIEILRHYTELSFGETEFLFCYFETVLHMLKITWHDVEAGDNFHLGDDEAFNLFQRFLHKDNPLHDANNRFFTGGVKHESVDKRPVMSHFRMWLTPKMPHDAFGEMSRAMDDVLYHTPVESVGGFKVHVVFNGTNFQYRRYQSLTNEYIAPKPSGPMTFAKMDPESGSYYVNFAESGDPHQVAALHVLQGNLGVLYVREKYGLMKPWIYRMHQVDFADFIKAYCADLLIATEARATRYYEHSERAFEAGNNAIARIWLERSIFHAPRHLSAYLYYCLGLVFHNLGRPLSSEMCFAESIDILPAMKEKINAIRKRM
jgi:tetratricopeptide (TPR) repeat protein